MPAHDLIELLRRLHAEAVPVLVESGAEAQSSREDAETDRRDPTVRWLLGEELHTGGADTTRRALEMAELRERDNLLNVASGSGTSALLLCLGSPSR